MEWTQALIPIVSSCAMTIAAMPLFIGYFQMKKQGQAIREEGPKWHNIKAGTPTMGGLVFLIGSILTGIWVGAWQKQLTPTLFILLFVLALYGVKAIRQTLHLFHGVPHRTQYVGEIQGRKFYNDSKATNILATKMALSGF